MEKTTTQELLAQAEKICAQRNVRLTPQRSRAAAGGAGPDESAGWRYQRL